MRGTAPAGDSSGDCLGGRSAEAEGSPLLKGRRVTGFTNTEERVAGLHDEVPFLLEDALKAQGGDFHSALLPMLSHVERDGNLLTGQNPKSSHAIAKAMVEALTLAHAH